MILRPVAFRAVLIESIHEGRGLMGASCRPSLKGRTAWDYPIVNFEIKSHGWWQSKVSELSFFYL